MGSSDRVDDRAFNANFSADGVETLKERVIDKLKEFMGEYTDETLAEYVIVLLRNGRCKEEAKSGLDVFLGDDSDSFVSWLWDHLAVHLDLYVQPKELREEAPKRKLSSEVHVGNNVSQHFDSQSERGKSHKSSISQHNKDWKGVAREETEPSQSSEVDNAHLKEKARSKVNHSPRSRSPSPVRKKRGWPDGQLKTKKDVSKATMNAPRRLLQFAVRDAVATSGPSNLGMTVEPSLKRLRSVVSTPSGNSSLVKHPLLKQSVSRVQNPMATVINAAAEAAEDVIEIKSSRSVFDRLGRGMNPLDGDKQLGDNYTSQEQDQSYLQGSDSIGQYAANVTLLDHDGDFLSDSTSDNELHGDVNAMGHQMTGASQIGFSSGCRSEESLMAQYGAVKNADDTMLLKRNRSQERAAAAPNASNKIMNISVNVNTWKPQQYQESREFAEAGGHRKVDSETGAPRSGQQLLKGNAKPLNTTNGNGNQGADIQKESKKIQLSTSGSNAAGRPLDDADARTIFVSNVHFAATKDSLSRHFSRFGEVLKVIILTEAATGQPKGSAYVEFMRKEAADNALSLDGTSFMSRILKVVKKCAAHVESVPTMTWPRVMRGSPFPPSGFSRVPFPRGAPAFTPWPPIKPGARSLQWKRDAQGAPGHGASLNASGASVPFSRSLTYVRAETKT
ncbi:uncharacterized protein LOC129313138 isoform X2 [Prosopis cineraria]|uniref:uncharacterized protein LOC129313138 isoform X2 n=1 Tax=Prosopis cineraria TaxID=364024 RepID=UPI0024108B43|nr:uncharacterized protein LOC129313138 isoform X2 [Prosopis cineraria]